MPVLSYTSEIVIEATTAEVFDFCSDLRNEMVWNPSAEAVEKLTDGHVGAGTRFRARWTTAGEVIVELVEFDRPTGWATRSTARGMTALFRGAVTRRNDGTRYVAHIQVRPHGLAWVYAPLAVVAMRRQEATNMRRIKGVLEAEVKR